jgi:UDP-N-acetylglucosamine diphosphorylase/glucosamine-1-phosphate N-acetyltransferase
MRIFLDDSGLHDLFYPLTTLRNFKELRTGVFSFEDRWTKIAAKLHVDIEWVNNPEHADLIIPANKIPSTSTDLSALIVSKNFDQNDFISINHLTDLIKLNTFLVANDLNLMDGAHFLNQHQHAQHIGDHPLMIHEKSIIEHCFINTDDGPVVIDAHAQIMSGSMLRGPVYIGEHSVVKMGAQLYGGSNIGKHCVVGGEIKNAIFHSYSNKAHHGYIGDSYIGSWCNLGAGTTGSNIKNTAGSIRIWDNVQQQFIKGPMKAGVLMGDHVKTAINTQFTSGTVISSFANIHSHLSKQVPKFVPMFSWGIDENTFYKLDKLLGEINRWMNMKGQLLTDTEKETITSIYKLHIR